jgi:hypothetical protein
LGHTRANFGTLTREGHNNKQCPLHWNALGPVQTSYSNHMLKTTVKRCRNVAQ